MNIGAWLDETITLTVPKWALLSLACFLLWVFLRWLRADNGL
jgi:hypothetical protein